MSSSKVFFCDFSTDMRESVLDKLLRLIQKAGIDDIDFSRKYVAVKAHFSEVGNVAYLRHNYVRSVVHYIKERGGRPFVTDCSTLYPGMRSNALDHLDDAYAQGYNPLSLECQVIIADGLLGLDEMLVPIEGEYVRAARIGSAIMQADIVVSLNHFKGHEASGFGGALKNLGMGCGSRAGKMDMHNAGKPDINAEVCIMCGRCIASCAQNAIKADDGGAAVIDQAACAGCGRCIGQCPVDAIVPTVENSTEMLARRIGEYAAAVVKGRPHFHVNFVLDVSPRCDCYAMNEIGIVPDIGIFASFDPVALDQACADAVNAAPPTPGSWLAKHHDRNPHDHFRAVHPDVCWEAALEQAEKMGIGTRAYEIVNL